MNSKDIKTWLERMPEYTGFPFEDARPECVAAEISELRQALVVVEKERDALKAELAAIKQGAPSNRPAVPLTDKQIFASEEIKAANAEIGLLFSSLLKLVRAIEAAHGIKGV